MSAKELRDQVIAADIHDALRNHRNLGHLDVAVNVRGGVAHVRGQVNAPQVRELVRRVIYRTRGVHAIWDVISLPGETPPVILDIGCGSHKQLPEALGVDCFPLGDVRVLAQIERGLPFADESVDQIYAIHFLEHIRDLLGLMNEVHRVLKPGGALHVMVPNWQFVNAVADPTHVRFFHPQTFKYFCSARPALKPFRPLSIAEAADDLFADLRPVKANETAPSEEELARFFD